MIMLVTMRKNHITACLAGVYVVNQRKRKKPYFATQLYQPSSNTYYLGTCDEKKYFLHGRLISCNIVTFFHARERGKIIHCCRMLWLK